MTTTRQETTMHKQDPFPYHFANLACETCGGKCCRGGEGYVWLSTAELENLANSRKMTAPLFTRQYARQVKDRISLQERFINGEHFCCFFDRIAGRCTVYQQRPSQCRTFPFWEIFREEPQEILAACPGVSLK
jgi:hypothetical protein